MAGLKDLNSIWKNIKEIDLKPIRDSATSAVRITIAGAPGVGKHTLVEKMRTDPLRPDVRSQSAVMLLDLTADSPVPTGNLVILIVEATQAEFSAEQALVKKWHDLATNVLVLINKLDQADNSLAMSGGEGWVAAKVISGSVTDDGFLQKEFVPAILEMLPHQQLALGRQFPLFRHAIARQLINDTCFSNAAYSLSTGLAEIVPVLDLPLNLTDMVVLTKTQAFLAYKLGLLVGFSTRWQDYLTEFGSVIGGGFIWRQAARSLVGLIPGWGIVPKVAVAYSGTYVVGQAVLGWYLSGRHLTSKQMGELSVQAFARGKEYARTLMVKIPRRSQVGKTKSNLLGTDSAQNLLPSGAGSQPDEIVITKHRETGELEYQAVSSEDQVKTLLGASPLIESQEKKAGIGKLRLIRFPWSKKQKKPAEVQASEQICTRCGKASSADAAFCQYCGLAFKNAFSG